jgi:hypothetical protein
MAQKDVQALIKSGRVLKEKYESIKGITAASHNSTKFEEFMGETLPDVTKIVFGSNLAMASATVEGTMNVLSELLGKGNLVGAVRGILAPFMSLRPSEREMVQNDLLHIIESLTRGYIPDYERPAGSVERKALSRLGWLGNKNLMLAQHMMTSIASSRAISLRTFITTNIQNGRLSALVKAIEEEPLPSNDPSALKDRMRKAGISSFARKVQNTARNGRSRS